MMMPLGERAHAPAGPPVFDERLMTVERQYTLAAHRPLRFSGGGIPLEWLDCAECGKGIVQLTDARGRECAVTGAGLLDAVLRHWVMRHDLSLSGGGHE
jgi:hypothetical protein